MAGDQGHLEREERVAELLRAAAARERAPARLREAIAELEAGASRRRRPRRGGLLAGLGASAAAAAAALALLLGVGAPTLAQAAAVAARGPVAGAPPVDPAAPTRLLSARVGSLHFPNWQWAQGWRASGSRHDLVDGRQVTTVYYTSAGGTVAYSIVSAPALAPLGGAGGGAPSRMRLDGRTFVVWVQQGHTCLLSGEGV